MTPRQRIQQLTDEQIQRGHGRLTADILLVNTDADGTEESFPTNSGNLRRLGGAIGKIKHGADHNKAVLITPDEAALLLELLEHTAVGSWVLTLAADPYEEDVRTQTPGDPS